METMHKRQEALLLLALALSIIFGANQAIEKGKLGRALLTSQNELAEAVGTVEVTNGVYARLSATHDDLNRAYDEMLGEHERLSEVLAGKEERIRSLMQTEARMDPIRFEGEATAATIISAVTEETNPNISSMVEETPLPNIRTEFDLEQEGFRVAGHTETNPAIAELTLEQVEPFIIDIAVTESENNQWRAIIYEQEGRLSFDVGVLTVTPQSIIGTERLRWYQRIGIGANTILTSDGLGLSPTVSARIGEQGAWTISGGPYWDQHGRGAMMGVTLYPFQGLRRR